MRLWFEELIVVLFERAALLRFLIILLAVTYPPDLLKSPNPACFFLVKDLFDFNLVLALLDFCFEGSLLYNTYYCLLSKSASETVTVLVVLILVLVTESPSFLVLGLEFF